MDLLLCSNAFVVIRWLETQRLSVSTMVSGADLYHCVHVSCFQFCFGVFVYSCYCLFVYVIYPSLYNVMLGYLIKLFDYQWPYHAADKILVDYQEPYHADSRHDLYEILFPLLTSFLDLKKKKCFHCKAWSSCSINVCHGQVFECFKRLKG